MTGGRSSPPNSPQRSWTKDLDVVHDEIRFVEVLYRCADRFRLRSRSRSRR
ncbi:hypothetical protein [Micromonospora qiuiae]|uniref:hypothetical protein n=1 Tax=Micromonospora qiuiae TaxID=502268 RepID=UPI001950C1D8|nr:hypothetical protein [Micromonospora qiuiae]